MSVYPVLWLWNHSFFLHIMFNIIWGQVANLPKPLYAAGSQPTAHQWPVISFNVVNFKDTRSRWESNPLTWTDRTWSSDREENQRDIVKEDGTGRGDSESEKKERKSESLAYEFSKSYFAWEGTGNKPKKNLLADNLSSNSAVSHIPDSLSFPYEDENTYFPLATLRVLTDVVPCDGWHHHYSTGNRGRLFTAVLKMCTL